MSVAFTNRIGAGFFGGEGFILQKLTGSGLVFLHACGTLHEMTLGAGELLRVDTGCLVAMQPGVDYDIQMVPGIKTALFGGEGLFFFQLTGPGRVILQTLPFSRLADRIIAASPRAGGRGAKEGRCAGLVDGDSSMETRSCCASVNPGNGRNARYLRSSTATEKSNARLALAQQAAAEWRRTTRRPRGGAAPSGRRAAGTGTGGVRAADDAGDGEDSARRARRGRQVRAHLPYYAEHAAAFTATDLRR